jgi:hypothetical protein
VLPDTLLRIEENAACDYESNLLYEDAAGFEEDDAVAVSAHELEGAWSS